MPTNTPPTFDDMKRHWFAWMSWATAHGVDPFAPMRRVPYEIGAEGALAALELASKGQPGARKEWLARALLIGRQAGLMDVDLLTLETEPRGPSLGGENAASHLLTDSFQQGVVNGAADPTGHEARADITAALKDTTERLRVLLALVLKYARDPQLGIRTPPIGIARMIANAAIEQQVWFGALWSVAAREAKITPPPVPGRVDYAVGDLDGGIPAPERPQGEPGVPFLTPEREDELASTFWRAPVLTWEHLPGGKTHAVLQHEQDSIEVVFTVSARSMTKARWLARQWLAELDKRLENPPKPRDGL